MGNPLLGNLIRDLRWSSFVGSQSATPSTAERKKPSPRSHWLWRFHWLSLFRMITVNIFRSWHDGINMFCSSKSFMSIFCDGLVGAHPVSGLDPASVDGLDAPLLPLCGRRRGREATGGWTMKPSATITFWKNCLVSNNNNNNRTS